MMNAFETWIPSGLRREATMRLFCLPCAGGGASMYHAWRHELPAGIDCCPVQLPGRENRWQEPRFTSLSPLVAVLTDAITSHIDTPFALFGHSMGGAVAFELARALRRRGAPMPLRLFVAGCPSPETSRPVHRHRLDDRALADELRRFGGTPPRLLEDEELLRHVLPTVRADFAVIETWQPSDEAPLPMPITAFAGADDQEAPLPTLAGWRRHTDADFRIAVVPGHHFFVQSTIGRRVVIEAIARDMSDALAQAA